MSYAIEVEKVPIRLRTLGRDDLSATIFVHPIGHADYRPESVGDRLNHPETRFLPCEIDGESQLVRLASIAYVELSDIPPEVAAFESVGAIRATVELVLKSNDTLRGDLLYEAERGEERVSDMLNRNATRFLLLIGEDSSYFVQREAIDRVKL